MGFTVDWHDVFTHIIQLYLTHWGRVTHICVGNLTINAGILLFGPLVTNFSEIWIEFRTFSFTKMHLKTSSGKWRPFCFGLNVLTGTMAIICANACVIILKGMGKINDCQKTTTKINDKIHVYFLGYSIHQWQSTTPLLLRRTYCNLAIHMGIYIYI